jgi:UDP:flavonoid glycosyltransferase YjiC (YdhE family)
MRFLLVTFPVASHYFPMVPLGWALAAAGHEVRVASHPSFVSTVESAGLTGVGVGKEPDLRWVFEPGGVAPLADPAADETEGLRAARGLTMFAEVAADMADELLPWARDWRPHLVVFEPRALAGVIVAADLGVPAVRHLWGVDHTYVRWPIERPINGALLARYGAGDADPHGLHTLDPCPPALQVPSAAGAERVRYVPYNGSGTPPAWLTRPADRPRVCVTWGTTLARQTGQIAPAVRAVEACHAAGAEVVVATTRAQRPMLGELPAGVRVLDSAPPLHLFLPTCAAVVHPGGSGTLLTALVAGVPQVVVPAVADQFLNADRLAGTGAGRAVLDPGAPALRAAVTAVLEDPGIAAAAGELSRTAASAPPPARAAESLAALAAVGLPRRAAV